MQLHKVQVTNFRMLDNVELVFEPVTTVIVGRNNSGKTSLSEVIRRFLSESSPKFQIEDFSHTCYDRFCDALRARNRGDSDHEVRALLPYIELRLVFRYDPYLPDLGPLADFIVDLDPDCDEALVVARYELTAGNIDALFAGQPTHELNGETRPSFFRALRERIPNLYSARFWAEDPNDSGNKKDMSQGALRSLLKTGFVNAQRGLDDTTTRETDVLSRILEKLFDAAASHNADEDGRSVARALEEAVQDIQQRIDDDFNGKLRELIPTLETFGYPGLDGPQIVTETTLDVRKLLSNHTKVRYSGYNGLSLPESYNGLGVRNLIFILLQIVKYYREFRTDDTRAGVHVVFIEEPEAHLHPQMQEVFIQQLSKVVTQLSAKDSEAPRWPVQFVVSTHSSHIANAANFEAIRYFLPISDHGDAVTRRTKVKDLRQGLKETERKHVEFVHKYLTLTRCDLFFADKAILVEGMSERLLLPVIIGKMEDAGGEAPKLSTQYLTILEVGGAYAHHFFDLIDFLELKTLIITDLDSVEEPGGAACPVHRGTATSNACIKAWFSGDECAPTDLLMKTFEERTRGVKHIVYQRPEEEGGACGRTFEDAFILANPELFPIEARDRDERERVALQMATKIKKSRFALKYAIDETAWRVPKYLVEGLSWLSTSDTASPAVPSSVLIDGTPDAAATTEVQRTEVEGVAE